MAAPTQSNVDLDALLDLSEYDNNNDLNITATTATTATATNSGSSYHSPELSPSSSQPTFASPASAVVTTPSVSSTTPQALSGPSHNYDMHHQQTGFVPGAIANTMAVNQTNNTGYQDFGSLDYLSNLSPDNDMFDFNSSPAQSNMDIDFESSTKSQQLFTIDPSSIEQDSSSLRSPVPSKSSSVGRLWPGAHSQAALAKAQAQQRQQQQQQQQHVLHQQQAQHAGAQQSKSRAKVPQPTDPIVEQKIKQLLNSIRAKSSAHDALHHGAVTKLPRAKKEEEYMDEDERLLASEEGKKLTSKERRQLRNKVSARAFRSRRKEYITQLEAEITEKVNENGDLRARNRALEEENRQLSELTHMLLGSPAFSSFLESISTDPAAAAQGTPIKSEPRQQPQGMNHTRKDVNPLGGQQLQQIGMAMVPDQSIDFSMLSLGSNTAYSFQPQVFVVETPDMPSAIDASVLSGKVQDFVEETLLSGEDGKMEVSAIERSAESAEPFESTEESPVDNEFECDSEFDLFHSEPAKIRSHPTASDTNYQDSHDIFSSSDADEKHSECALLDSTKQNTRATEAMARVQRLCANTESVLSRLELLTTNL